MQEKFSYSTQPHAAPVKRKAKYREDAEPEIPSVANVMADPRIVRGNTYAAKVMTSSLKREQEALRYEKERRLKTDRLKRSGEVLRSSTPPPVEGRMHMDIQTDDFLEELTDRPIEVDVETQTQPFLDKPSEPLFILAKTGQDVETQIDPGDLFDFDLEVEPILEVLVGKTIHVAMLELMQEEELEAIRRQQEEFEAVRNVELAEVQRLEAEARRKQQEKDRRVKQERERLAERTELEEKIAARSFAQQYLSSLHNGVFAMLQEEGHFYDPVKKEVEEIFLGEVLASYKDRVELYKIAQEMAEELLNVARENAKVFEKEGIRLRTEFEQKERARLEQLKAEEEAKRLALAAQESQETDA